MSTPPAGFPIFVESIVELIVSQQDNKEIDKTKERRVELIEECENDVIIKYIFRKHKINSCVSRCL